MSDQECIKDLEAIKENLKNVLGFFYLLKSFYSTPEYMYLAIPNQTLKLYFWSEPQKKISEHIKYHWGVKCGRADEPWSASRGLHATNPIFHILWAIRPVHAKLDFSKPRLNKDKTMHSNELNWIEHLVI